LTCLLPRRYSAHEDERVESLFSQLQRHPGAGRFACSSTVQINVLVLGQNFEFLGEIVGFDADRSFDTLRVGVVVSMAADIQY
jgi:hypothetical protein